MQLSYRTTTLMIEHTVADCLADWINGYKEYSAKITHGSGIVQVVVTRNNNVLYFSVHLRRDDVIINTRGDEERYFQLYDSKWMDFLTELMEFPVI